MVKNGSLAASNRLTKFTPHHRRERCAAFGRAGGLGRQNGDGDLIAFQARCRVLSSPQEKLFAEQIF